MGKGKFAGAIAALVALAAVVYASTVTVPNTFVAGTPAKAADVNANFSALATAIQALQNAQGGGVVQDSNGKILGSYYPGNNGQYDYVLMKQAGLTFLATITSAGFYPSGGFSYTQYDCGGTQYIFRVLRPALWVFSAGKRMGCAGQPAGYKKPCGT
jgi:hypothetical protein